MRLYLDTNVLVSLISPDPLTPRAEAMLEQRPEARLLVSDFGRAEFVSALRRRVRTGEMSEASAHRCFGNLDRWTTEFTVRVDLLSIDVAAADALLRRMDLTIRTPDALHVVMARRLDAPLATFDGQLAAAARLVGIEVVA